MSGVILLVDLEHSRHKIAHTWGLSSEWTKRYFDYSNDLTGYYARAFSRQSHLDGEPLIVSHLIDRLGPHGQRVYAELTQPQGISDMMQTVVLREARRIALFVANRHESAGALMDDEVAITRLLVPHIRRAVTIGDILDAKKIEAQTLAATLDNFTAGVLVVGDQGRILHANNAAQCMLSAREPVAAVNGHLSVRNARANDELSNAISLARTDEGMIAGNGIGVPLRNDGPSIAHVLPLARGDLRTRLMPQATAAVFVTQAESFAPGDIGALAGSFGLTPAEARMLERLAGNATVIGADASGPHFFQDRSFAPSRPSDPRQSPRAAGAPTEKLISKTSFSSRGGVLCRLRIVTRRHIVRPDFVRVEIIDRDDTCGERFNFA